MAGYAYKDWTLYLRLIGLGMRPVDAVRFIGVQPGSPYSRAARNPAFKQSLIVASQLGHQLRILSPGHFVDERGRPILDSNFDPIPRDPPGRLFRWLHRQHNPLAMLAG